MPSARGSRAARCEFGPGITHVMAVVNLSPESRVRHSVVDSPQAALDGPASTGRSARRSSISARSRATSRTDRSPRTRSSTALLPALELLAADGFVVVLRHLEARGRGRRRGGRRRDRERHRRTARPARSSSWCRDTGAGAVVMHLEGENPLAVARPGARRRPSRGGGGAAAGAGGGVAGRGRHGTAAGGSRTVHQLPKRLRGLRAAAARDDPVARRPRHDRRAGAHPRAAQGGHPPDAGLPHTLDRERCRRDPRARRRGRLRPRSSSRPASSEAPDRRGCPRRRLVASRTARTIASASRCSRTIAEPETICSAGGITNTTVTIATSWTPTRTTCALSTSRHSAAVCSWRSASTVAAATRRWRAVDATEPSAKPTASSPDRASVTRTRLRRPRDLRCDVHEHGADRVRRARPARLGVAVGVQLDHRHDPAVELDAEAGQGDRLDVAHHLLRRAWTPWARMWTSVGRPMSSVTTRAAETSGSRQSSRSSSRTSSSGPSPLPGVVTASSTCCSMVRASLRPGRPRTVAFRPRRSRSGVPGRVTPGGAGGHPSLAVVCGTTVASVANERHGRYAQGHREVVPSYSRYDRLPNPARERSGRSVVARPDGRGRHDRREGGHRGSDADGKASGVRDRRVLRAKRCPLAISGLPERYISKKVISHEEDLRPSRHAHVQHGCTAARRRCSEVEVATAL